jgi:hypothetical protein
LQDINIKEKLLRKKHLLHFEVEKNGLGSPLPCRFTHTQRIGVVVSVRKSESKK